MTRRSLHAIVGTLFSLLFLGILFVEEPVFNVNGFYSLVLFQGNVFFFNYLVSSAVSLLLAVVNFMAAFNTEE
jgi:hypothetical protein